MSTVRRKIILFTGSKDSGKTTLIGKIFNIEKLSFEEPTYYKDYIIDHENVIREIAGRREVVNILRMVTRLWNIDRVIVVADASRVSTIYESLEMSSIFNSDKKCLVLNKIDEADEKSISVAEQITKNRNIRLFMVSCKTGEGLKNLSLWIQEETIIAHKAQHTKDIVPVPSAKIPLNIRPDMSIEELRDILPQNELDDIDRQILSLIDGKRTVSNICKILSLSKFETAVRIRKLKNKGYIKELKIVIT